MPVCQSDIRSLESAAMNGNLKTIQLLTSSQTMDTLDHYNVLKKSICSGQTEAAKLLINKGCKLSTKSHSGLIAPHKEDNELLHLAISAGNLELVELLMQKKMSTEGLDAAGMPPLFKLVDLPVNDSKVAQILNCLIEKRARISIKQKVTNYSVLHYAAEKGNAKIIPLLVEKKCPLNIKSKSGLTALHIAAKRGNSDVVDALLKSGAKDTLVNDNNMTPLCLAIESGNLDTFNILLQNSVRSQAKGTQFLQRSDINLLVCLAVNVENIQMVKSLLSHGATVNNCSARTGQSPLHMAVKKGNIEIMTLLLEQGPNLNELNREGYGPLHLACTKGDNSIVSTLLGIKNCDINAKSATNLTALHLAIREGHTEIISLLLKKGADYNVFDKNDKTPLTLALENTQEGAKSLEILLKHINQTEKVKSYNSLLSQDINVLMKYLPEAKNDKTGNSVLHLAVQDENVIAINILLRHQACIHVLNKNGHTPFDLATINGSLSIVDIFLQSTKDKESLFFSREDGYTPMHLAVKHGNTDMLELFFRYGILADISKPNALKSLHIAVQKKDKDLIMLLLKNGATVDVSGRTDVETPLFIAAETGSPEVVEMLSEVSTARSSEWREGYILLYVAAYHGHEKVVKQLLDKQVNPNAMIDKYLTPLHAAAQMGHEIIVRLLLEHGAEVNPKRKDNTSFISTPLLAAAHAGHRKIATLLIKHGADVNQQLKILSEQFVPEPERILIVGSYKDSEIGKEGSLRGYTSVHFAVEARDKTLIKLLINRSAVVNFVPKNGVTAIGLAIEEQDETIIKLLLSAGANVLRAHRGKSILNMDVLKTNVKIADIVVRYTCSSQRDVYTDRYKVPLGLAVESELEAYVKLLLKARENANIFHNGEPLLNIAIKKKNFTIFEMLLEYGINLNACTDKYDTALIVAVEDSGEKFVQMLLDAGADTKIVSNSSEYRNYTPIEIAILMKDASMVEIFLKKSIFKSSFELALKKSNIEVVKTFLNYGASINDMIDGKPPLFLAVKENNLQVVNYLLKKGASLEKRDTQGTSVLYYALKFATEAVMKLLFNYGAGPNVGGLLMEEAIRTKNVEFVKLALLNGANLIALNSDKETPFNFAVLKAVSLSVAHVVHSAHNETLDNPEKDRFFPGNVRLVARMVTKEVARREAITGDMFERNRISVRLEYVQKYYKRCLKEIEFMKITEICQGITYFDLLIASPRRLASLIRNNHVKSVSSSKDKISKLFPEYVDVLCDLANIGMDRRTLLDYNFPVLKKVLRYELPLEIVEEIFSFLETKDLRNLKNCFYKDI